jgi:GNAT superfamily N-acetyltransferase
MKIFYLEMLSPEALRPKHTTDPDFRMLETAVPQPLFNKYLYALVGRDWHWIDKLRWTDEQWQEYATDPGLRTWVAYKGGTPAGYFELQKQPGDNIEIAYFGLTPDFIGQGFGGALLTEAITQAWAWEASRVWVHTCTLDHPGALANYQARGFMLYDTVEK